MDDHGHLPVLLEETLSLLAPAPGEVAVDGTAGRGGHAERLANAVAPADAPGDAARGTVILFDLDAANLAAAAQRVRATGATCHAYAESFVRMDRRVADLGLRADVVLADLGFSSTQMDDPDRGFGFRHDAPLDMRYDRSAPRTAADLLATLDEAELADLIFRYGEEPLARKIARIVAREREVGPIDTTAKLAEIVGRAYGSRARTSRVHPATRTFMALRIAVNEELEALRLLLDIIARGAETARGDGWLRPGARIAVISFHSLEDRMVKRAFAEMTRRGTALALVKGSVTASLEEVRANPRARSARLRAIRIDGS